DIPLELHMPCLLRHCPPKRQQRLNVRRSPGDPYQIPCTARLRAFLRRRLNDRRAKCSRRSSADITRIVGGRDGGRCVIGYGLIIRPRSAWRCCIKRRSCCETFSRSGARRSLYFTSTKTTIDVPAVPGTPSTASMGKSAYPCTVTSPCVS